MRRPLRLTPVLLLAAALVGCHSVRVPPARQLPTYDDEPWARVLAGAVVDGRVDYGRVRRSHREELDRYLDAVRRFGPRSSPELFPTAADRLAYLINAYNALMIQRWLMAGAGASDDEKDRTVNFFWFVADAWRVDGRWVSLNTLEQAWIRRELGDPRVHFALVCGADGCPPLRDAPYAGAALDAQLDDQGRRWIRDWPNAVDVRPGGAVALSPIFMWYIEDFDAWGGLAGVMERYLAGDDPRRGVIVGAIRSGEAFFVPYDWTINDASRRGSVPAETP